MSKIISFFKSPHGSVLLFVTFLLGGGLMLYGGSAREKSRVAQATTVENKEPALLHASISRVAAVFKPGPTPAKESSLTNGSEGANAEAGSVHKKNRGATPVGSKPHVFPLSLISVGRNAHEESDISNVYAPYGRLIPCETIVTLESSKLDTPVIGLVTEDVWHNGKLIIPAGAEVHGRASVDRSRERIAASGQWVVVWRDGSEMNGTEIVLNGIALEREKDEASMEFGLRDGSAGLVGDLLRTDNLQEVKLFASTFIAGLASGMQKTQTQSSPFGAAEIATGTARDAALHGTADVLNNYARQIQEAISRDGFFVRVPAGKQFYIYVTETIDQSHATRGNRRVEEIWKKNHEN